MRNLLKRFLLQQDEVLAFLDDLSVPFTNKQAERDLRDLKVQQLLTSHQIPILEKPFEIDTLLDIVAQAHEEWADDRQAGASAT
jgi:hypothetical protein